GGHPPEEYLGLHYQLFSYVFPFWILIYYIEGLYTLRTYNPANLPISILRGTFLSVIVSVVLIYVLPLSLEKITPKTNLVLVAFATLPLLSGWRRWFFNFFAGERRLRRTFIVGSQETLDLVKNEIT